MGNQHQGGVIHIVNIGDRFAMSSRIFRQRLRDAPTLELKTLYIQCANA